jgi:hypothetical protein
LGKSLTFVICVDIDSAEARLWPLFG